MARPTPESFEKRQRERRKKEKRADKLERRLIRNEEKRFAKEEQDTPTSYARLDEDGNVIPLDPREVGIPEERSGEDSARDSEES